MTRNGYVSGLLLFFTDFYKKYKKIYQFLLVIRTKCGIIIEIKYIINVMFGQAVSNKWIWLH